MKHSSLAAHYRPQTFAEVAGQDMITTVLSRAAAADQVAPAYLLSGTRGVGKTTIARILAKALNCVHAPCAEPCNQCDQCRKITSGSHVDVTEIDGASNNSVEDARALRENIGYAPMEARYKVFIIDEAHMLSRSAFNALLKTLEEPPPRVVFIFATTEAHKFPITIVSRCQHFIFRRLPEAGLAAHLTRVLRAEDIPFEENAVRLLARRAAGSVRDAMSLLGQTLALGGDSLTAAGTRQVLGLAGQDFLARLLDALAAQDCAGILKLLRQLLDQGVDIGFFLRELAGAWRTLFLLRQAGASMLPVLDLPEDEGRFWLAQAPRFSPVHIHAAWQMVLNAQRQVIHSPEPAAALELLLLNLALMPRLLPLDRVPLAANAPTAAPGTPASTPVPAPPVAPGTPPTPPLGASASSTAAVPQCAPPPAAAPVAAPSRPSPPFEEGPPPMEEPPVPEDIPCAQEEPAEPWETPPPRRAASGRVLFSAPAPRRAPVQEAVAPKPVVPKPIAPEPAPETAPAAAPIAGDWEGFCAFCAEHSSLPTRLLRQTHGDLDQGTLRLDAGAVTLQRQLEKETPALESAAREYFGGPVRVEILPPRHRIRTEAELVAEFREREELRHCLHILDASLQHVRPVV